MKVSRSIRPNSSSTEPMSPTSASGRFQPRGIGLVIFDFDGTLAELTIDFKAMKQDVMDAAARSGLDWAGAGERFALEAIDHLAGSNGPAGLQFAAEAHRLLEEREVAAAERGSVFPGVRRTLARLTASGREVAIITRNCRRAVETVFPDVEQWCHLFVPRDDAPKPKPAPEHVGLVLDRLDVPAGRSLVVGDHPIDITTARRAGTWACGVTTGRIDAAGLAEADLVLDSVNRLPGVFGLAGHRC